jgi:DNA-binding transcriptional LysR family regulator
MHGQIFQRIVPRVGHEVVDAVRAVGPGPPAIGAFVDFQEDLFGQNGVSLSVAFQASNTLALMGLVRAGLGITILPESIVPALHA